MRSWSIWQFRPHAVAAVLAVEVLAVGLTAYALVTQVPTVADLGVAVLVLAMELVYVEVLVRLIRPRRRTSTVQHGNLTSVVTFAAVLQVSPGVAALVAVVVSAYEWLRIGPPRAAGHRMAYRTATLVLACLAAWDIRSMLGFGPLASAPGLLVVVPTMIVYALVESVLTGLVVVLTTPARGLGALLGDTDDNLLELATLALGALTAAAVAITPWLAVLVLPAMLVLQRALLVPQLTLEASVDGKTGLLNVSTWHERAVRELASLGERDAPRGVLVIDLDHFKTINDTYGHVAGDVVLAGVAEAVRGAVRARDPVGRFGGEEFVVLVAPTQGGGPAEIEAVAQRIRRLVAALRIDVVAAGVPQVVTGLHVSIGVGLQRAGGDPADRGGLAELLHLADTALYAAKRAGRDQVRTAEFAAPNAAGG